MKPKRLQKTKSKLGYRAPKNVLDREAMDMIAQDDIERLRLLPIDLGFNHENWRFIQDVCVRLSDLRDTIIRANALMSLSYVARFRGRLDKNVVKPVLLRGLRDSEPLVAQEAADAIEAINKLMGWRIGRAKRQKELEARYEQRREA